MGDLVDAKEAVAERLDELGDVSAVEVIEEHVKQLRFAEGEYRFE